MTNSNFTSRQICPACGSASRSNLCDYSYVDGPIRDHLEWYYTTIGQGVEFELLEGARYCLEECGSCGLIYQRHAPGEELLERLYNVWIDTAELRRRSPRRADYYLWSAGQIAKALDCLDKAPRDVRFLDFGMGFGNWCILAKGFGCDAWGTDLSEDQSNHAAASGIQLFDWNAPSDRPFDFINAEQVFEHLTDPLDTLKEFRQMIDDNGVVRISVPVGWDVKRRLAIGDWSVADDHPDSLNAVAPLQHINCFNFTSLRIMAETAGFRLLEFPPGEFRPSTNREAVKLLLLNVYRSVFPVRSQERTIRNARRAMEKQSTIYLRPVSE